MGRYIVANTPATFGRQLLYLGHEDGVDGETHRRSSHHQPFHLACAATPFCRNLEEASLVYVRHLRRYQSRTSSGTKCLSSRSVVLNSQNTNGSVLVLQARHRPCAISLSLLFLSMCRVPAGVTQVSPDAGDGYRGLPCPGKGCFGKLLIASDWNLQLSFGCPTRTLFVFFMNTHRRISNDSPLTLRPRFFCRPHCQNSRDRAFPRCLT